MRDKISRQPLLHTCNHLVWQFPVILKLTDIHHEMTCLLDIKDKAKLDILFVWPHLSSALLIKNGLILQLSSKSLFKKPSVKLKYKCSMWLWCTGWTCMYWLYIKSLVLGQMRAAFLSLSFCMKISNWLFFFFGDRTCLDTRRIPFEHSDFIISNVFARWWVIAS